MRRAPVLASALFAIVLGACGGSDLAQLADRGDYSALKGKLTDRQKRGDLTNRDAADVARAVAAHEVASAHGDDALARVREVGTCASDVDDVLAKRMETRDAAGAQAALLRLDAKSIDEDDVRSYASDADDAWRAVGIRGLVRAEDRDARLHALVDPAPAVRRSAVAAIAEVRDARDAAPLAEAARVDPEGIVRTDAVRALARFVEKDDETANASAKVVIAALRDLWAGADDALREDLASTWASQALLGRGGREELRVLVATEHGPGALTAAWLLTRVVPRDSKARADVDDLASAGALLARALDKGSRRERLYALTVAPLADAAVLDAVHTLSRGDDVEAKMLALARLLEIPAERGRAMHELENVAGQPAYGRLASRAQAALAGAGDMRVQAWIEKDLEAPDAGSKLSAASSLTALGRSARGAPLLADADPSVRTRAACTLLFAAHRD